MDGARKLRDRELNPGLPRDKRKYQPLYYRGLAEGVTKLVFEDGNGIGGSRQWGAQRGSSRLDSAVAHRRLLYTLDAAAD